MTVTPPVVVGVDGSTSAAQAVAWAAETAVLHGSPLLVFSATDLPVTASSPIPLPPSYFSDRTRLTQRRLDDAARIVDAVTRRVGDLVYDTQLVSGPATPALLELSRSAGMVVLGTRGLSGVSGWLARSVTSALALHSTCPVAVIRGWPMPGEPPLEGAVVVGVDGSANCEPALALGFAEASLRRTDLVAVHAWRDIALPLIPAAPLSASDAVTLEESVLAQSLAGWQEKYPDVPVRRVVVEDRPAHYLRQHAEWAQLLVVGSKGRGGFTGMLLGSTSAELLHTAPCPLLLARSAAT